MPNRVKRVRGYKNSRHLKLSRSRSVAWHYGEFHSVNTVVFSRKIFTDEIIYPSHGKCSLLIKLLSFIWIVPCEPLLRCTLAFCWLRNVDKSLRDKQNESSVYVTYKGVGGGGFCGLRTSNKLQRWIVFSIIYFTFITKIDNIFSLLYIYK